MTRRSRARTRCAWICAALVGAALPAHAAPRAVVSGQSHLDAGKVEPGQVLQYEFTLRNEGDATLAIEDLKPTCYCTSANIDQWDIPAGGSTIVHVRIDPSDFTGDINKGVEISTNDPEHRMLLVDVDLHVLPGIAVVPPELDFGAVGADGSKPAKVDIKVPRERDLKILEVKADAPYVSVTQEPLELEEKHGVTLYVKVLPGAPPGAFTAKVTARTNDTSRPTIEIPLRGRGPGGLRANPEKMVFTTAQPGAEVGTFDVTGGTNLLVRSSSPNLVAEIRQLDRDRSRVMLRLTDKAPSGRLMERVVVSSQDGKQPELTVTVMGIVR
jgi:uncharacterized protein DUF1573